MKHALLLGLILIILSFNTSGQNLKYHDYPITPVPISHVHLTDNFWLPKIKTLQNTTISFGFNKCQKEGRMDNFLIAGGKMQGTTRGEMPFDDTDVYKIIEGASNSLLSAPDKKLEGYLDSIISIIRVGQEPDGYLTTWITIDPLHPPAKWAMAAGRWKGEISNHELYNSGHLFEAAATHYTATGKRNLLDIALKNADLLVNTFGPGKLQAPPGHQIVETGLVKLYRITQNENYLNLARFFLDVRGDSTTHKLYGAYNQDHLPVIRQEEPVGHAVRAIYMYAGMTDIGTIYNDQQYLHAVEKLWQNMVNKKMYITGGIGSRHEGEAFGENYELPNMTGYNETCAAIGDVYWNHRMFMLYGDSKYYDVIERTLYNGLISGISLDGDEFFYPNPLESDGKYAFNFGSATRSPWFSCSCCPTNLIRFIPSVPGLIYATNKDSLYVNLFASNKSAVQLQSQTIEMIQQTDYPWNGKVDMTINPAKPYSFTLKIRIPGWSKDEVLPGNLYAYANKIKAPVEIKVNGKPAKYTLKKGYAEINKQWQKGDKVEFIMPMKVRKVVANALIKEDSGKIALEYGPVVYCAEAVDNNNMIEKIALTDNTNLSVQKKETFLNGVNVLTGKVPVIDASVKEITFTAIPYYTWSNRGANTMKVWFPRK